MLSRSLFRGVVMCASWALVVVGCAPEETPESRFESPDDDLIVAPRGPCTPGTQSDCLVYSCIGTRTCSAEGAWGTCDPGAVAEVCDGEDNDCDGVIDNPAGGCGESTCTVGDKQDCATASCLGQRTCGAGEVWGACEVATSDETCDGIDNNCDGLVDNLTTGICDAPTCTTGATRPCNQYSCTGTESCVGGEWSGVCSVASAAETCDGVDNNCNGQTDEGVKNACGACGAVPTEVPNNVDDNCNGQTDEGFALTPLKTTWAVLQSHNFGCNNAYSPWWQCQQVADTVCKGQGYLGGYGPVDWDDGGATGVWIECIGHGAGATIAHINPAGAGVSFGDSQARKGEDTMRKWCFANGYNAAVGTVRWYGDGTVDVLCLPGNFGTYRELSQQWLTDRGCADPGNGSWATPICSRAAHLTCINAYGHQGIPFWVFGNVGLICLPDDK